MTTGAPETSGRRSSERSGLRVLLYVLLALGGLLVLTCGGLLFLAARNPAVQQFFETVAGSQSAPGTQELRDAGCTVAQVFDLGSALALLSKFKDQGISETAALMDLTLVQCVLSRSNASELGCDEVAEIYSSAVPDPPDRFLVQVTTQFSSKIGCRVVYRADGTPIAPLDQYDPKQTAEEEP